MMSLSSALVMVAVQVVGRFVFCDQFDHLLKGEHLHL
jgi:hypothetical protein